MRLASIAFAALGLMLTASAAAAEDQVTDVAFLKANRCRGLAAGLSADTSGYDAFIKAQDRSRAPAIEQLAYEQRAQAQREAHRQDGASRLQAELDGACQAYKR
jgi:hypothetical protein